MHLDGYSTDIHCFKAWASHAAKSLSHFYSGEIFSDYPPGYIYVLWLIGKIKQLFSLSDGSMAYLYLIKLPAVLADVISVYFIYRIGSRKMNSRMALGLAFIYAINPAIILNSAVWGQVDAIFTLMLAASLYYLYNQKLRLAVFWYVIAVLFKPQALLLAPIYLFLFIEKTAWKCLLQSIIIGLAAFVLLILPFAVYQHPLWIFNHYLKTLGAYPFASLNAFNLFTLFGGNWVPIDQKFILFSYETWGYLFLIGTVTTSAFIYFKKKDSSKVFYVASFIYTAVFMTSVKMHERYLFPVLLLMLISFIYTRRKSYYTLFLAFCLTHFMNVAYVLYNGFGLDTDIMMYLISAVNMALFILLIMTILEKKWNPQKAHYDTQDEKQVKMVSKDWLYVLVLMLIYGCIAFINLGDKDAPQTFYSANSDNGTFIIDFGEVRSINNMTYYTGSDIGGKLHLSLSSDGEEWREAGYIEHKSVFYWDKRVIANSGRYIAFMPEGTCKIGELAFYVRNQEEPIRIEGIIAKEPKHLQEITKVIDEQEAAVSTPSYKNSTYFDEIYFARTAYEYLHGDAIYEYTHPPLGKLMISIGIGIFGMTPFGWRFCGTVIGILMVGLIYIFGKRLFGKTKYAVLAALVMVLDGMHFAQIRIAAVDGFLVFFIMLSYYFMYRYIQKVKESDSIQGTIKPLLLSGLFFAFAISTKWSAIYGGIGLGIIFFYILISKCLALKKRKIQNTRLYLSQSILWASLFFVVLPLAIYILSYLPELLIEGGRVIKLIDIMKLQKEMYLYHSQLTSNHPFASRPWTWPLLIKPVWYYTGRYGLLEGNISSIALIGNPIIWWSGIFALFYTIHHTYKTKNKAGLFLIIGFFSQFLPCFLISREMFLYHYFPSLVFLMLVIVYAFSQLERSWGSRKMNSLMLIYGFLIITVFILFYPILSGAMIPRVYGETFLRWLKTWIFL